MLQALKALLDSARLQYLILYLSFIRDVHYRANFHPGLAFEEDIQQLLAKHEGLRESILHDPLAITAKATSDALLAVRESEDLLRLAAEAGNMLAYVWDVATDQIVRSAGVRQILGEGEGTHTTGQQILSMIPLDDQERLLAAIAQLTPENPFLHIRHRMVRSDGSIVWVNRTSRAYFDQQGRLQRMIGMLADITDRMRVDEALASVNRQLIEAQENERIGSEESCMTTPISDSGCWRLRLNNLRTASRFGTLRFGSGWRQSTNRFWRLQLTSKPCPTNCTRQRSNILVWSWR